MRSQITAILALAVLSACGAALAGEADDREDTPEKLYVEGMSLFQNRNFEKAEKIFEKVVALKPNHLPSMYMRGACRLALGSYEAAAADFDAVLEASPRFSKALAQRGRARLCLGRYEEARGDFESALALSPDDPGWKADLEQAKMLHRGTSEFGPGDVFPDITLNAPAPKGKQPPETGAGGAVASILAADRTARALAADSPARGLVLVFFQGMASPVERSWLSDMSEFRPDFEELGFTVAAVFPDPPDVLFELQVGKDLSLPLFTDPQGRAAWKLGILNTRRKELGEPLPTVFVIDASGRIVSRGTFLDASRRVPVEKLLKDLAEKTKKDGRDRDE